MELSFYGWLWMIVGAVFVPMEVTAYVASIIKVVLDRYRIKKTNTARRQSKLTGVPPGRRLNILIINDEERAFKLMSNGHCRSNRKTDPPRSPKNAEDSVESIQQNGGHSVKVTIEYNLEVRGMSEDVALLQHDQVLKDNAYKKITGAKRSITIDGDSLITYASFSDGESKIGIVSNSGTFVSDGNSMSHEPSSRSSISLPDLSPKEHKQPPPKPKRNQSTINKKASITEVQKWSSNMQVPIIEAENKLTTDISSIDDSQDVSTSKIDDKKSSLSADPAHANRRYSSTSATDTDCQAMHSSPNLSRSEDCLYSPPREVHLTKSSSQGNVNTGHFSGHTNVAFTDSSEEMKTNL